MIRVTTLSRDCYDWELALCFAAPVGSANRMHYARLAMRCAPTPGTREFARAQYVAARRAFEHECRRRRPRSKDFLVIAITLPPSIVLGSLLTQLLTGGIR
ncbi:hypothetical protein [Microbacterium sp. NPDC089696]|uniref:hypothetical protein n=1 Tax=Microbacterium sp. NPDC089696 TaxID=3364199 RepID=UPI003824D3D0